jgi:hypothetical protein
MRDISSSGRSNNLKCAEILIAESAPTVVEQYSAGLKEASSAVKVFDSASFAYRARCASYLRSLFSANRGSADRIFSNDLRSGVSISSNYQINLQIKLMFCERVC